MYIFGASGHGKVIASTLIAANKKLHGFIDDAPKASMLMGVAVTHSSNFKGAVNHKICIGVGDNATRKRLSKSIQADFVKVIHPSAQLCKTVSIAEGTVVFANVIVNAEAQIGAHAIINTGAIIEHDCVIEDYVHISPNATIAGGVTIGEGTHIGIGACVIPGVTIGKWATIGAGAVIIKDVPDGAIVVGNPGKIIKYKAVN
jgi:acetyltransferase EpsM